ncbi:MAG: hypothetical protein P4L81_01885 [Candidatus Pacebacteria bacterium]|nr:hypothetical protein [Candidatus Paceibacterota bacterium]
MQIMPASCPSNPFDTDAPNGCSGSTPLCPDGTGAPNNDLTQCSCGQGNTWACVYCSVSISPNPASYAYSGTPVTISWSTSGAGTSNTPRTQAYINNIGYVDYQGTTYVAAHAATDYSCYSFNSGKGTGPWYSAVSYVNAPPTPSVSITAGTQQLQLGQSTTITGTFAAGSGDVSEETTFNEVPPSGSEFSIPRYSYDPNSGTYGNSSSISYPFTPTTVGSYVFKPYIITAYYAGWSAYGQSITVNVTPQTPACSFNASPSSVTQGQSSTLTWSCTNATSCTGTNFSTANQTSGSVQVSPSQTTTYSGSCTGTGGTTPISQQVTVTCQQAWSCNGGTIIQTNTDCSTTNLSTCTAPQYCQNGSNQCLYPAITVNQGLKVTPNIVQQKETTQVSWNVANAQSCTVVGSNNDGSSQSTDQSSPGVWNATSGTKTSSAISTQTTYTLSCKAYPGNPDLLQTQAVDIAPAYHEL